MSRPRKSRLLDGLNEPQADAVSTMSGPLLVLAGAGTGKTRVVTFRIANLIANGTKPERILGVTFTNKASKEMQERIGSLIGKKLKTMPLISTFHSHCVKVLRRHIDQLGYPTTFAIYDRGDQEGVARSVLRDLKVPGAQLRPGDLLYLIGNWKNKSIGPERAAAVAETDKEHLGAMGYRRYQQALKTSGSVDFDDLLVLAERLFAEFPKVRRQEAALFDHLLVDEYQDTNGTQYRIVKALAGGHRNLCVVGDDDQSIYGWRGAEVEHILKFKRDWPEAKMVQLVDNYRSTNAILTLANRVIAYNSSRYDKVLQAARAGGEQPSIQQYKDETQEAEQIVADIRRRTTDPAIEPRDIAILFRTNEQPRAFELELRKAKVPYVLIGGQSFYDRKEIRDILAYLKTIAQPIDEVSLLRIFNTPARGISKRTVEILMEAAVSKGMPIWDVLPHIDNIPGIKPKAAAAIKQFRGLITHFQNEFQPGALADATTDLITKIDYRSELTRQYENPSDVDSRWDAIEEVVNALSLFEKKKKKKSTLKGFLDDTALAGREQNEDKEKQLKQNAVTLITMHAAKGLEFPQVYMVGMEEGLLPHHRSIKAEGTAIEEERRLCYVGITRAMDRLTFSMALTRMKWGKPRDTEPSRFLFEVTGKADNPNA